MPPSACKDGARIPDAPLWILRHHAPTSVHSLRIVEHHLQPSAARLLAAGDSEGRISLTPLADYRPRHFWRAHGESILGVDVQRVGADNVMLRCAAEGGIAALWSAGTKALTSPIALPALGATTNCTCLRSPPHTRSRRPCFRRGCRVSCRFQIVCSRSQSMRSTTVRRLPYRYPMAQTPGCWSLCRTPSTRGTLTSSTCPQRNGWLRQWARQTLSRQASRRRHPRVHQWSCPCTCSVQPRWVRSGSSPATRTGVCGCGRSRMEWAGLCGRRDSTRSLVSARPSLAWSWQTPHAASTPSPSHGPCAFSRRDLCRVGRR